MSHSSSFRKHAIKFKSNKKSTFVGSPAAIGNLPHVFEGFAEAAIMQRMQHFCDEYENEEWAEWDHFWLMVKDLSALPDGNSNIGVVMNAFLLLESSEESQCVELDEVSAMRLMRGSRFLSNLSRCFSRGPRWWKSWRLEMRSRHFRRVGVKV